MINRSDDEYALLQLQLKVADTIGALMEFWGFRRSVGRLWTVLYMSPEPLGAADLGELLTMSTGSVSMTIAELAKWGAIKKTWVPGERRDFYEVETSIWKLLTRVLREREMMLLSDATTSLLNAEEVLNQMLGRVDRQKAQRLQFILERIHRLMMLATMVEAAINAIVEGEPVDPIAVRDLTTSDREPG